MVNETEEPKKSVLDETKEALEEFKKVKEELEKLRSDQLLSGTAGVRVEPEPPKPESAKEYVKRLEDGEFNKQ